MDTKNITVCARVGGDTDVGVGVQTMRGGIQKREWKGEGGSLAEDTLQASARAEYAKVQGEGYGLPLPL